MLNNKTHRSRRNIPQLRFICSGPFYSVSSFGWIFYFSLINRAPYKYRYRPVITLNLPPALSAIMIVQNKYYYHISIPNTDRTFKKVFLSLALKQYEEIESTKVHHMVLYFSKAVFRTESIVGECVKLG